MTLGEILDQYEDIWRSNALSDALQFCHTRQGTLRRGSQGPGGCAMLGGVIPQVLSSAMTALRGSGACPVCKFTGDPVLLGIHLNNKHQWDWLDFANMFRALVEPQQKG